MEDDAVPVPEWPRPAHCVISVFSGRRCIGRANSRKRVIKEFVRSTSEEIKPASSRAISFSVAHALHQQLG